MNYGAMLQGVKREAKVMKGLFLAGVVTALAVVAKSVVFKI